MNFLYPAVLWGLTALAIPIIVHLFNFRKAKKVYFSNVRFLEDVKKKSSSKLRLKHLLVLACRLLFICLLIMAFAQPFIPGKEEGFNKNQAVIFLDNSRSMSNLTTSGISGFSESLEYANQIIDLYPSTTQFRIITNDFLPSSNHVKSGKNAKEIIPELDYSDNARNGEEILNRLIDESQNEGADIFIISDFQKSTVGNLSRLKDSTNSVQLLSVKFAESKNIFVDSVYLSNPFLVDGQRNQLHVSVRNSGEEVVNDLVIKFHFNGRQAASASVDIEANSFTILSFELNFELQAFNECQISFEDFPVIFDNEYHFTLNQLSKIKIAEIVTQDKLTYLDKVFAQNDLFDYKKYEAGNISYDALSSVSLLIFNGIEKYDQAMTSLLQEKMQSGTSVLVIPSEDTDVSSLSLAVNQSITLAGNVASVELEMPDPNNPFFEEIFTDYDENTQLPIIKTVLNWSNQSQNLLATKTGQPFLSRFTNNGELYLMSAPLQEGYSDLYIHSIFVPVMYKMAILSNTRFTQLGYFIDDPNITIPVDSIPINALYKLKNAEKELIPSQKISSNQLLVDLPKYLITPGIYDLTINDQVQNKLAFNTPKAESFMSQMTPAELSAQFESNQNVRVISEPDPQSFTKSMKEKYHSVQLWKYALALSLLFLVAETLILRYL